MTKLLEIIKKYPTDKWQVYEIYERIFKTFKPRNLLEIGVQRGGSLMTWRDYLPGTKIYGIDNNVKQARISGEGIKIFEGDQTDKEFLLKVMGEIDTKLGMIIDDGGHKPNQQIRSFEVLFPFLRNGGIYVIEDIQTSFWKGYTDCLPTAVEYFQGLAEKVVRGDKEIESVEFYNYVCVIKKK